MKGTNRMIKEKDYVKPGLILDKSIHPLDVPVLRKMLTKGKGKLYVVKMDKRYAEVSSNPKDVKNTLRVPLEHLMEANFKITAQEKQYILSRRKILQGKSYYDEEDEGYYIDDEGDRHKLLPVSRAKGMASKFAHLAQKEYDKWDESNEDTYARGGICHFIADAIASLLNDVGILATTVSSSHEQHVYVIAVFIEGVYSIDIHWSVYEKGGGFTWKKIPDVKFDASDITFYLIDSDPQTFSDNID